MYEDVYKYHLNNAESINIALNNSEYCACINSKVIEHIKAFYGNKIQCNLLDVDEIIQSQINVNLELDIEYVEKFTSGNKYILTTGNLDEIYHLSDLVSRAVKYLTSEIKWIHAGVISPRFLIKLYSQLDILGYAQQFDVVGILSRERIQALISKAKTILIAEGTRDTSAILVESRFWNIDMDIPDTDINNIFSLEKVNIKKWIDEILK